MKTSSLATAETYSINTLIQLFKHREVWSNTETLKERDWTLFCRLSESCQNDSPCLQYIQRTSVIQAEVWSFRHLALCFENFPFQKYLCLSDLHCLEGESKSEISFKDQTQKCVWAFSIAHLEKRKKSIMFLSVMWTAWKFGMFWSVSCFEYTAERWCNRRVGILTSISSKAGTVRIRALMYVKVISMCM